MSRIAITLCPLHLEVLLPETVEVFHGCVDYSPGYGVRMSKEFPCAMMHKVSSEGREMPSTCNIHYCKKCRAAWYGSVRDYFKKIEDDTSKISPEMLIEQTTLENYLTMNGTIDPAGYGEKAQGRIEQRRADVHELMRDGDTLWTWSRLERFRTVGGLALLRGESVVIAWRDWKS